HSAGGSQAQPRHGCLHLSWTGPRLSSVPATFREQHRLGPFRRYCAAQAKKFRRPILPSLEEVVETSALLTAARQLRPEQRQEGGGRGELAADENGCAKHSS